MLSMNDEYQQRKKEKKTHRYAVSGASLVSGFMKLSLGLSLRTFSFSFYKTKKQKGKEKDLVAACQVGMQKQGHLFGMKYEVVTGSHTGCWSMLTWGNGFILGAG